VKSSAVSIFGAYLSNYFLGYRESWKLNPFFQQDIQRTMEQITKKFKGKISEYSKAIQKN
jgi:hypothetical protein